jgi:hypothetical protein
MIFKRLVNMTENVIAVAYTRVEIRAPPRLRRAVQQSLDIITDRRKERFVRSIIMKIKEKFASLILPQEFEKPVRETV